ncbi:MAG: alpha/beta hydrolase fold domain-containing protein [Aeromicrobium sp.]
MLDALKDRLPSRLTIDMLPQMRQIPPAHTPESLADAGFTVTTEQISTYDGDLIEVSVLRPVGATGQSAGIVYTHGGGMIMGDRWLGLGAVLGAARRHGATIVTIEYRRAPEFPDPAPVEDCYAGLVWTAEHADALGIDVDRILIAGSSAGGGLAAGTALLARDRGGPQLAAQLLMYPMLDDRDATTSTQQIDGVGVWDRASNRLGWDSLLGERRGGEDVSIYAAPARAADLSGLPPTYIDCGSAEVFRDEDVAYATALWAAGGDAELHVWAGGFHGFDELAAESTVAQEMLRTRESWLDQVLGNN